MTRPVHADPFNMTPTPSDTQLTRFEQSATRKLDARVASLAEHIPQIHEDPNSELGKIFSEK